MHVFKKSLSNISLTKYSVKNECCICLEIITKPVIPFIHLRPCSRYIKCPRCSNMVHKSCFDANCKISGYRKCCICRLDFDLYDFSVRELKLFDSLKIYDDKCTYLGRNICKKEFIEQISYLPCTAHIFFVDGYIVSTGGLATFSIETGIVVLRNYRTSIISYIYLDDIHTQNVLAIYV